MMSVLAIGYGRHLFDVENTEHKRLVACAEVVDALHMIVFSRSGHTCADMRDRSLHLHPTQSRSQIGMLFDAYRIGSSVFRSGGSSQHSWIISTQDPFEAGLVGYLLHLRYRIPLQVQEHGDFFGSSWWRTERFLNRLRYVFGKWLLRRAECVRTVSKRVKAHLAAIGVDSARVATLAVFSDTTAFTSHTTIADAHNLRAQYPGDAVSILAVGRLVKEKNFALLIRAFGEVVAAHPTARLVIIGSGSEKFMLMELVKNLDLSSHISFIPWTDDLVSYMRSADIFSLSSYREGWGRVIIEAMAAGLPGVVTDVGCVGEIFINKRHGIVVPVADQEAFRYALEALVSDVGLRREYGEAARRDSATYAASQGPYAQAWRATFALCGRSEGNL